MAMFQISKKGLFEVLNQIADSTESNIIIYYLSKSKKTMGGGGAALQPA